MKKVMIAVVALLSAVTVMFAQQDKTGTGGTTGYPPFGSGVHLFQRVIDFSDTTVNTGTVAVVYQMIDIPAGTKVLAVGYELLENRNGYTGDPLACTIDIGDGSDTDGWLDGSNVRTGQTAIAWGEATSTLVTNIAGSVTNLYYLPVLESGVNGAYSGVGKLYTATDTIDMIMSTNAVNLKIRINAIGIGAKKDW